MAALRWKEDVREANRLASPSDETLEAEDEKTWFVTNAQKDQKAQLPQSTVKVAKDQKALKD